MGALCGRQVLIVDDDPMIRFIVSDEVEYAGAEVAQAEDGHVALELIENGLTPDALVTDVRMPRVDGWTLAERLRERLPKLAVLYVTGSSDVSPRPVTGSHVIHKPFRFGIISDVINELVNAQKA